MRFPLGLRGLHLENPGDELPEVQQPDIVAAGSEASAGGLGVVPKKLLAIVLAAGAIWPALCHAQVEEPVVRVVMFYGPTCPHCHEIIKTVLPPLQEQYGDQLDILLVNTDSPDGDTLFHDSADWLGYPRAKHGTPLIVVGATPIRGEENSAEQLPTLVAEALAAGGCDWPPVPGIEPFIEKHAAGSFSEAVLVADMPIRQRFMLDPYGGVIAVGALVVMIASIIAAAVCWRRDGTVCAGAHPRRGAAVLVLATVGLFVAAYLAYVEMTNTEAVCGPVGHCNLVQQSQYATLFGFLPVGLLGVIGYVVVFGLWGWERYAPDQLRELTSWGLPLVALSGVLFSVYLTFLEPFVIGAVCMWCVSSAVIMTGILWTTMPVPVAVTARYNAIAEAVVAKPSRAGERRRETSVSLTRKEWAKLIGALVFAQFLGVMSTWLLVRYGFTEMFPAPATSTVAQANLRATIENGVLISGLIVGPGLVLAWRARH